MAELSSLQRRARTFSALGDPMRLAIVDHLTLADAAPGDLGRALGISTNLLAHHLRVLEEAAVIRRVRSEGDQRRSYVRLRLDDPIVEALGRGEDETIGIKAEAGLGPCDLASASRVVFVCTHNSARSQFAAALWTGLSATPAASAGTHPAGRVHPRAVAVGRRHGLRLSGARPAHTGEVLRKNDLVVAVCDKAHEQLGARGELDEEDADGARSRLHWSVRDPVRIDTDAAFEAAYQDVAVRVDRLARAMTGNAARPRRGTSSRIPPKATNTRRTP